MEVVPELAECKTKDDAEKKLRKLAEKLALEELMRRKAERDLGENEQAVFKVGGDAYVIGNCITGMEALPANGSDFVLAEVDPPYGIDLPELRKGRTVADSYNEIPRDHYPKFLREVAGEVYRVLAPNAWCVWWYGQTWHNMVLNTLKFVGFDVDEISAVWVKNQGQTNLPDRRFARAWEPFFLCRKGNPTMHKRGRLNVFQFTGVPHQKRIHDTERPIELIQEILNTLCIPGVGKVLVPFLGSGNTLRAAFRHGMGGIGWDIDGEETKLRFIKRLLDDVSSKDV
jgi:site-specific DNA-methyltransferase (adenine-specific)